MELTMRLPTEPSKLAEWGATCSKGAYRLAAFRDLMRFFGNREVYDFRLRDGRGALSDHPFRDALLYGTQEEADKGFILGHRAAGDDAHIRAYALTPNIEEKLPLASLRGEFTSAMLPAYTAWMAEFSIGPAAHVYILRSYNSSEAAVFFFPIAWGPKTSIYLVISVGGRYGETHAHLFDGDPAEYAKENMRSPRSGDDLGETDLFFSDRRDEWPTQPLHEAPSRIPLSRTYYGNRDLWGTPSDVMPCDIWDSLAWLKQEFYTDGKGPWLATG